MSAALHVVGMVLHPERDSAEAVAAILGWAERKGAQVLGVPEEVRRLNCAAVAVTPADLARRSDLLVSLGGDGTMLRAMRLAAPADARASAATMLQDRASPALRWHPTAPTRGKVVGATVRQPMSCAAP